MTDSVLIGVDVGGTLVRAGAFDHDGRLLAEAVAATTDITQEPDVEELNVLIETLVEKSGASQLAGIGVGVTGQIIDGTVDNPFTLAGWHGVAPGPQLEDRWEVPVVVENDADAAALGEFWQGAGRNERRLFVMTIGTGIGSGLVIDGEPYRGVGGLHPEAGHQLIDPTGPPCFCGSRGCLEVLVSGTAIQRTAAARGMASRDAEEVAGLARQGDPIAQEIYLQVGRYLCLGLVNVITMLAPTKVLIGGGVASAWDLIRKESLLALRHTEPLFPRAGIEIAPCALGWRAGMVGAAFAALPHRRDDQAENRAGTQ